MRRRVTPWATENRGIRQSQADDYTNPRRGAIGPSGRKSAPGSRAVFPVTSGNRTFSCESGRTKASGPCPGRACYKARERVVGQ